MSTRQGLQPGAPMDDNGWIPFSDEVAARIADSGAEWVRLNFRLGANFKNWTETDTLGFSALSRYDIIVDVAQKHNLKILGLVCNEAGGKDATAAAWRANSAEVARGNGDNDYIRRFAQDAVAVLVAHFAGKISHWQIWNEPNSTPTLLYPSNFAWLLRRSYEAARQTEAPDLVIIAGGAVSTHGRWSTTLTSSNTGADFIRNTYRQGKAKAGWEEIKKTYGSYPLDAVAQHLYIDPWQRTSGARIEQATGFVHGAYVAEEGGHSSKPLYITEMGWTTANMNERLQADNLRIAYTKLKTIEYIPTTFWFFLQDVPLAKLWHGLLREDGSEKPAFFQFRLINDIQTYPKPQTRSVWRQRASALRRWARVT